MEEEALHEEPVYRGLIIPASFLSVPYEWLILGAMAVMTVFILAGNPLWLMSGFPVFFVLRFFSERDRDLINLVGIWLAKCATNVPPLNRVYWGGASYGPDLGGGVDE